MGTRGRKSGAALAVAPVQSIEAVKRPDAPYDLTDEESDEWWAVVTGLPADWFPRETHALLTQYCRHVVNARRISQLIQRACSSDAVEVDDYDRLLKMQERETKAITALATKMRMPQQSTTTHRARKSVQIDRPWAKG